MVVVDDPTGEAALAPFGGVDPPEVAAGGVTPESLGYLLFTSGTSGAPKACRCTQGRLARIGTVVAQMFGLTADDVCYSVDAAVPLERADGRVGTGAGRRGGLALPSDGRFSASGFLPDVRRFGATYFNYVGKPLAYVLATPERPDDAENPLVRAFGNEGASADVARFARAVRLRGHRRVRVDGGRGDGATDAGHAAGRARPGAGGHGRPLPAETGEECPPARFDEHGRLVNAEAAIGELVSQAGAPGSRATGTTTRQRRPGSGKAGTGRATSPTGTRPGSSTSPAATTTGCGSTARTSRAAPVERIVERHPDVVLAAVYAVPDPVVGDQVMAAVELRPGTTFDPAVFADFLAAQDDLGTKWAPRFVRVAEHLPTTATNKVLKRTIRAERWRTADPIWWRPSAAAATSPSTTRPRPTSTPRSPTGLSRRQRPLYITFFDGMYIGVVRRINIYIDDELDRRAEREARRRQVSKAALIRQSLLAELGPAERSDPVDDLVGLSDAEPADDIDAVVYGG